MKRIILLLALLAFLFSCTMPGVTVKPPNPMVSSAECNASLDAITAGLEGDSLIRAKVPNPCDAYRVLATVAKAGVIWEQWQAQEVIKWGEELKAKVQAKITYDDLILLADREVKKLNAKLAGTYILLTGLAVDIQSPEVIKPKDAAILTKGLDGIIADAKRMAALTT